MRFNDTLRLKLNANSDVVNVEVLCVESVQVPSARTYHACCLVGKFMVICGGEAAASDLDDIWAFDLETQKWHKLENLDNFHAKRFHSASAVSGNRIVTFGGCHSEYVHLNDVNVFDLSDFVNSNGVNLRITCEKLSFAKDAGLPSTRWGHTACVHHNLIYILGGRNESDISDLHTFDIDTRKWTEIDIS